MSEQVYKHVAIIGVGLLGGSLGMALKKRSIASRIVGVARREQTRQVAVERGCVDDATADIVAACTDADLIVICTPVGTVPDILDTIAAINDRALVTDVGSTKASIVTEADGLNALAARFVGSHPMAGSEEVGPQAASEELYEGRPVIVTPGKRSADHAVAQIESLWRSLGMVVHRMEPELHDRIVARISHMPHALSVLLMNAVGDDGQALKVASTGLADTTRLAGGDVAMWTDIFMDNAPAIIECLEEYRDDLTDLCEAMIHADREQIEAVLLTAQRRRQAWCERYRDRS